MKKNRINAFTLVEMLIVIVIIGILIAALMPRMQAAQGRARDVSRKTALSQVQSAIVTSQGDKGKWPLQDAATEAIRCTSEQVTADPEKCPNTDTVLVPAGQSAQDGVGISSISSELKAAGMSSIPVDPLKSPVYGLGNPTNITDGDYLYLVATRNGTPQGGFALMAKTEVVGGSNWVVCGEKGSETAGALTGGTDLANITLCDSIEEGECTNNGLSDNADGKCKYSEDAQLRYLLVY